MPISNKISKLLKKARELPQTEDVWECMVRKSPSWVRGTGDALYRPPFILVTDETTGMVRHTNTLKRNSVSADDVLTALLEAMINPMGAHLPGVPADAVRALRPAKVKLDRETLMEDLATPLAEPGIALEHAPELPMCEEAYQSLLEFMNPGPRVPAIIRVAGPDDPMTAEFFAAAELFYRAQPWLHIYNNDIIEIHFGDGPPRYCSVMGNGGQEFGIVVYGSMDDVVEALSEIHPAQMRRGMVWLSATFDEAPNVALDDLDHIERRGIAPVDWLAYPMLMRVKLPQTIEPASLTDMQVCAATMRVLPQFVVAHMFAADGEPQAATASFALPEAYGGGSIRLSFPVAGLDERLEESDVSGDMVWLDDDDDDDDLDAEEAEAEADALEAEMAELAEGLEPGSGKLILAINSVEPPVRFSIDAATLKHLKPKPRGVKAGEWYEAFNAIYAATEIGIIIAFLLPRSDVPWLCPIVMLEVESNHPLTDAIKRYQQSRAALARS